jgi:hypothetical protein
MSILLHSIIHVGPDSPHRPQAPIRKYGVGWDIDVDLTALQAMLLKESTIVLRRHVPVASLHKGIPQQHREAMTLQTPRAQPAILKCAIRVVSHLKQEFGRLEFSMKDIQARHQGYQKNHKGGK